MGKLEYLKHRFRIVPERGFQHSLRLLCKLVYISYNNLGNYWTSSGPYDEIFYYIEKDISQVRDALALIDFVW